MATVITINVETDDEALAERIGRAINGNLTETVEGPPAATDAPADADDSGEADDGPGAEAETETQSSGDSQPQDHNGVPFDSRYCGNAKEPFYSSGKRAGQWKKKKGVTDEEYDAWYNEQLAQAETQAADHEEQPDFDTASAFGQQEGGGYSQPQHPDTAPQNTGDLMAWASEKQTAGLLTQEDIAAAYQHLGLGVQDLFPPASQEDIAQRVQSLYGLLSQKAGA